MRQQQSGANGSDHIFFYIFRKVFFNAYRLCIGTQSLLRQLWILSTGEKKEDIGISQDDCKNRNNNR